MTHSYILPAVLLLITFWTPHFLGALGPDEIMDRLNLMGDQSSLRIQSGGKVYYIDPFGIPGKPADADFILITHPHNDHMSDEDIFKIIKPTTIFVCPKDVKPWLVQKFNQEVKQLEPGRRTSLGWVTVEAVPAYNWKNAEAHPKSRGWMGYILTVEGVRIYHAGDTERIPEMKDINCGIVLIPLGQVYTMSSVQEAVDAVMDVKAQIAIPIHYGYKEGTEADILTFQTLLQGKVRVVTRPVVEREEL